MNLKNIEIKARCTDLDKIRRILTTHDAEFKGTDHQIDTYFRVKEGRLKLREGTIEKNLIYYRRDDTKTPKNSDIDLVPFEETKAIKNLLKSALDVKIIVDKKREIYFIGNVKFHLDVVKNLGTFMEIEAIDENDSIGEEKLRRQCEYYMDLLRISEQDLVARSYSDLLLER